MNEFAQRENWDGHFFYNIIVYTCAGNFEYVEYNFMFS